MTELAECGRARLMLRFPHLRAALEKAPSENFLDVCGSYELACRGLEYWTQSNAPSKDDMVGDYRNLIEALELEAQFYADNEGKAPASQVGLGPSVQ